MAGPWVGDVEIGSERVVLRVTGNGSRVRAIMLDGWPGRVVRSWARVRGDGDPGEAFLVAREPRDGEPVRPMAVSGVDHVVRKAGRAARLGDD